MKILIVLLLAGLTPAVMTGCATRQTSGEPGQVRTSAVVSGPTAADSAAPAASVWDLSPAAAP